MYVERNGEYTGWCLRKVYSKDHVFVSSGRLHYGSGHKGLFNRFYEYIWKGCMWCTLFDFGNKNYMVYTFGIK